MRAVVCFAIGSALVVAVSSLSIAGSETPALDRIRTEARQSSQALEIALHLCDVIGPRLTGSPQIRAAFEWTRRHVAAWDLADVRLESWGPFGAGWTVERTSAHMVAPDPLTLIALPRAWSPATNGVVRGRAVRLEVASEKDLSRFHGKLAERIVLLDPLVNLRPRDSASFKRLSEEQLSVLSKPQEPIPQLGNEKLVEQKRLRQALRRFLLEEHALATLESGQRDGGTLVVATVGDSLDGNDAPAVPALVVAAEHYNRIVRLIERGVAVELAIEVQAQWQRENRMSDNLVAELRGGDLSHEVVMIGAHLDSWHGGAGATDNAAGAAIAMEAMRLLRAIEARPRRTIRLALWSGEEQGMLGSRAYVKRHFGWRDEPKDEQVAALPFFLRPDAGRLHLRPGHERLYAYFNLDYGTGRIRGLYLQGNAQAAPLLLSWLKPLADLDAATVSPRSMRGSDHQSFESIGLPAFMFLHDDVGYFDFAYHTNMDLCDRLVPDDLVQASIVAATVVYQAAMSDRPMPRMKVKER